MSYDLSGIHHNHAYFPAMINAKKDGITCTKLKENNITYVTIFIFCTAAFPHRVLLSIFAARSTSALKWRKEFLICRSF